MNNTMQNNVTPMQNNVGVKYSSFKPKSSRNWTDFVLVGIIIVILIVLVIAFIYFSQDRKSNVPLGERCRTGECEAGLECQEGICKAKIGSSCQTKSQCVSEADGCVDNVCVKDVAGVGQNCVNGNCNPGLVCEGNVCLETEGGTCTSSSDCSSSAPFCVDGVCSTEEPLEDNVSEDEESSGMSCRENLSMGKYVISHYKYKNNIVITRVKGKITEDVPTNISDCSLLHKYRERLYVVTNGNLMEMENHCSNPIRFYCAEWAPKNITYIDSASDGQVLWLETKYRHYPTKTKGYLYHKGKLFSTYTLEKGMHRYYGETISDYEEK